MYRFQAELPTLPMPPLAQTLTQYLRYLQPLVTPSVFRKSEAVVSEFGKSPEAQKLHAYLVKKQQSKSETNWLRRYWSDLYLLGRESPGLYVSPVLTFPAWRPKLASLPANAHEFFRPLDSNKTEDAEADIDVSTHAAVMMEICAEYYRRIARGTIEVDKTKSGAPFCMDDYWALFGTSRLPQLGCDVISSSLPHYPSEHMQALTTGPEGDALWARRKQPRHAVVMCQGSIYAIDVLDQKNAPVRAAALRVVQAALKDAEARYARKRSHKETDDELHEVFSPGSVTALGRNEWAAIRAAVLNSSAANRRSLSIIEAALFVISLDVAAGCPKPFTSEVQHHLFHGHTPAAVHFHGSDHEAPSKTLSLPSLPYLDRWFDKSIHFHCSHSGGSGGLTFEHSAMDSLPVLMFSQFWVEHRDGKLQTMVESSKTASNEGPFEPSASALNFERVYFTNTKELEDGATTGLKTFSEAFHNLDLSTIKDVGCGGAKGLKAAGISPDAFIQLCGQVAYQLVRGAVPSTYESAATKTFLHGRTETIRSTTPESQKFVEAFAKHVSSDEDAGQKQQLAALMRAASAAHSETAKLAARGDGMDRHLLGLRMAADELRLPKMPGLFTDPAFKVWRNITLSTTHPLPTPGCQNAIFGPVSPRCIGFGYFCFPSYISGGVTAWRDPTKATVLGAAATDSAPAVAAALPPAEMKNPAFARLLLKEKAGTLPETLDRLLQDHPAEAFAQAVQSTMEIMNKVLKEVPPVKAKNTSKL